VGFRERYLAEDRFPRMSLPGDSVNRGKTFFKARRKTLHLAYIQPPTYLLRLVTVVPNW
jgi:hypothetical protein